jgi:hypothetical protein
MAIVPVALSYPTPAMKLDFTALTGTPCARCRSRRRASKSPTSSRARLGRRASSTAATDSATWAPVRGPKSPTGVLVQPPRWWVTRTHPDRVRPAASRADTGTSNVPPVSRSYALIDVADGIRSV